MSSVPGRSFLTNNECLVESDILSFNHYYFQDPVCGTYGLSSSVATRLSTDDWLKRKVAMVLAQRRCRKLEAPIFVYDPSVEHAPNITDAWILDSYDALVANYPPSALRMIEEALYNISCLMNHPSESVTFDEKKWWLVYAYDTASYYYMIKQLSNAGWIENPGRDPHTFTIASRGWDYLSKLRITNSSSTQAFVAMRFSDETKSYFEEGIRPAIEHAKYSCFRVDLKHHNNKICDEIISEIRKSKFLVADFTGHRGGVYYEAGFAHGLGMTVIWTVHSRDISGVHFDTRQYNHITYDTPEELREKLSNRINATIP